MDKEILEYTKSWIKKAENDLKNIENNLKSISDELPTDTLCFHCQQAIEKYLKAYLSFHQKEFPHTHNLADLVQLCISIDKDFKNIIEQAELFTPFAVEYRYPDDYYLPDLEEMKSLYKETLAIRDFILSKMRKDHPSF